jgi:hypothetical protein
MTTKKTSPKKPASKKSAAKAKPYIQSPGQLGTGVIPVTPPLSSEQARKQLRGF